MGARLELSQQLIQKGDNEKADSLTDKYFESIPYSTGYLDRVSVQMANVYATTNPEKGEEITVSLEKALETKILPVW